MDIGEVISRVGVVAHRDPELLRKLSSRLYRPNTNLQAINVRDLVELCLREVYLARILGYRRVSFELRSNSAQYILYVLRDMGWSEPPTIVKSFGDVKLLVPINGVRVVNGVNEALVINVGRPTKTAFRWAAVVAALTGWRTYLICVNPITGKIENVAWIDLNSNQRNAITEAVLRKAKELLEAFQKSTPPPPKRGSWCLKCPHRELCAAFQRMQEVSKGA